MELPAINDNEINLLKKIVINTSSGGGGGGDVASVNGQTGVVVLTKSDISLGNVDNTSDANKPVSTAQATADALVASNAATALSAHTGNTSNPHSVTKSQVGLANADNTSDANKPVSTATQTALNLKADLSPTDGVTSRPSDSFLAVRGGSEVKVVIGSIQTTAINKTIAVTDHESLIRATASVTIQLDGVGAGTRVYVASIGSNNISFTAGAGMSISGFAGISGDGAVATLIQISSSVWEIYGSSPATSLNTGLFAFYPLDESASATTRRDVFGGETVTATAASGSAAGKTRKRALLMAAAANQAMLSTVSAGDFKFSPGSGAIMIAAWVKATALTNAASIATMFTTTGNKRVFGFDVSTAGKLRFFISVDGTSGTGGTASSTATLSAGTWYHCIGYYNPATGKIGVIVNGGTADETTVSGAPFSTTGQAMQIGAQEASATTSAALQDIGFWSRILSAAEIARLYNSGSGLSYPFLS